MHVIPHLLVSMPHVKKLADFLVLLLPIYPLTGPGTIQGGLAYSAVLELDIRQCLGATDDAALGHACWDGWSEGCFSRVDAKRFVFVTSITEALVWCEMAKSHTLSSSFCDPRLPETRKDIPLATALFCTCRSSTVGRVSIVIS